MSASQRRDRQRRPIASRQLRAVPEHVAANGVYAMQNAKASSDDQFQFELQPERQPACQGPPRFEQVAGALHFEGHESPPVLIAAAFSDLRFFDVETLQVVLRKVNPSFAPVDGNVLPEI